VSELQAVRTAVLRDYPLRLWAEQNEYFEGLIREFSLLVIGEQSAVRSDTPRRLLDLAEMFRTRFGGLLQTVNAERQDALDRGLDRIDSHLPLVDGLPAILEHVREVLQETDEFCRRGRLITLPRSPALLRFGSWTGSELTAQYHGAEPTPWPGPF